MRLLVTAIAVVLLGSVAAVAYGGEVSLTIVNVVTPQDVKIWEPTSITVKKGDKVSLRLVNKHPDEHGYEIAAQMSVMVPTMSISSVANVVPSMT